MYMIEIVKSEEFLKWLKGLRDMRAQVRIAKRLDHMEVENFGDCSPIGEGLSEARIHYGPGYRLYFLRRGEKVIVMLGGGDKGSQKRDIAKAKQLAEKWR